MYLLSQGFRLGQVSSLQFWFVSILCSNKWAFVAVLLCRGDRMVVETTSQRSLQEWAFIIHISLHYMKKQKWTTITFFNCFAADSRKWGHHYFQHHSLSCLSILQNCMSKVVGCHQSLSLILKVFYYVLVETLSGK